MNNVVSIKSRPFVGEKGEILSDKGFVDLAVKSINEYEEKSGKPAPVSPNFKQWLKETQETMNNGGNIVAIKEKTIVKSVPDYAIFIENTERQNKTLEKQGIFR